ncbi:hypothetical protein ZIOFF_050077 [Zingiber officinale]|uniref:Cupin type-1 domain-containing protein n=1 Tax=Zingiber officinale TaxID=94328 RepID=A0A8J5FPE6_ZINOF|nr:hypothetical protein ZIOFF_050077 [Zingiber officinale]
MVIKKITSYSVLWWLESSNFGPIVHCYPEENNPKINQSGVLTKLKIETGGDVIPQSRPLERHNRLRWKHDWPESVADRRRPMLVSTKAVECTRVLANERSMTETRENSARARLKEGSAEMVPVLGHRGGERKARARQNSLAKNTYSDLIKMVIKKITSYSVLWWLESSNFGPIVHCYPEENNPKINQSGVLTKLKIETGGDVIPQSRPLERHNRLRWKHDWPESVADRRRPMLVSTKAVECTRVLANERSMTETRENSARARLKEGSAEMHGWRVNAEDFFTDGLDKPGNTINKLGSNVRAVNILKKVDVFVFPQGLVHFQFNRGHTRAVAIAALSSQNSGTLTMANVVFGSKTPISNEVLAKAFRVDQKTVDRRQAQFWMDTTISLIGAMTESVVRNFTRHILNELTYLHTKNIMHRSVF